MNRLQSVAQLLLKYHIDDSQLKVKVFLSLKAKEFSDGLLDFCEIIEPHAIHGAKGRYQVHFEH